MPDELKLPFVSAACRGESCFCGAPAMKKIEEGICFDEPVLDRHPHTAYVCHLHFRQLMGLPSPSDPHRSLAYTDALDSAIHLINCFRMDECDAVTIRFAEQDFDASIEKLAALTAASPAEADVRWAVNVLLEKIAIKFEGWDTMDLWRSDAASTVRSFKHDLSSPAEAGVGMDWKLSGAAAKQIEEIDANRRNASINANNIIAEGPAEATPVQVRDDIQRCIEGIESLGFKCEAGPLEKCGDWKYLKRLVTQATGGET